MNWKTLLFILVFLAFVANGTNAKEHRLPFLMNEDVGKAQTIGELHRLIEKMPDSSVRKQKLFDELQKNLGLTKTEFSAIKDDPARVKLVGWNDAMSPMRIAALVPETYEVDYWRDPNSGEIVVMFLLDDGNWWPVVMLNCANPVITYEPKKKQPKGYTVYAHDEYNGCEEVGYPYPHMSARIGSHGVVLHGSGYYNEPPQFTSVSTPVKCSRDVFMENNKEER